MKVLRVGSDFSGVGALDQALIRIGVNYKTIFSCDMDKFARETYIANYGEPEYYPENVYDREIPKESVDLYVTSPPCQAFSVAGKRLGKEDKRGILFFNSLEFIQKNKPRYFIFENVKGLLSHDKDANQKESYGKTFQEWINLLGGKSINDSPILFAYENSVPYHIHFKVLNAKKHGVPHNRERIFIVGIRDDQDNNFSFPKEIPLVKRLKDVLEENVDEKYFLSEKMMSYLLNRKDNFNNGKINFKTGEDVASCINSSSKSLDISDNIITVGNTNPSGNGMNGNVFDSNRISPTLSTNKGEGIKVLVNSGVIQMNPSTESGGTQPYKQNRIYNSDGIAPTLDTECGRPSVCISVSDPVRLNKNQNGRRLKEDGDPSFTITSQDRHGIYDGLKSRRLTPVECFRLMDFPDSLVENARRDRISDSQLYKQAGNTIVVQHFVDIISKLNLTNKQ